MTTLSGAELALLYGNDGTGRIDLGVQYAVPASQLSGPAPNPASVNAAVSTATGTTLTAVTVTHGLSWTPSNIIITPTDGTSGAALAGYWISGIGSTTFQVNFIAFTGTLNFNWQAF